MKNFTAILLLFALAFFTSCQQSEKKEITTEEAPKKEATVSKETQVTVEKDTATMIEKDSTAIAYVCPPCGCSMHDSTFTAPGSCPACHMALVKK